jgi:hypothetical protein
MAGRESGTAQPDNVQRCTPCYDWQMGGDGSYGAKNGRRMWPVQEREGERTKKKLARPKGREPRVEVEVEPVAK